MSTSVFCTATSSQTDTIMRNLEAAGFTPNDISVLMADKRGTRDFALEHNTKTPEGTVTGAGSGLLVEEPWAGWLVSAHSRFRAWDHSSPRVQSSLPSAVQPSVERWVASREPWSAWGCPSSKPNSLKEK